MDQLLDLVTRSDFAWPCALALVLTATIALVPRLTKGARGPAVPVGAAVLTGVALGWLLVDADGESTDALALGVVALACASLCFPRSGQRWWPGLAARAPGAALVVWGAGKADIEVWVGGLVALVVLLAPPAVDDFDSRRALHGLGPLAFAAATAGLYACVPETDQVVPLLGASIGVALVAWPSSLVRLGRPGIGPAIGLFAWASAVGGGDRPASTLGAVACLGVLVLEPAVRLFRGRTDAAGAHPLTLLTCQAALVLVCSRGAGLRSSAAAAAAIVVIAYGAATAVLAGSHPRRGRP